MSDIPDFITAGIGVATTLGGGIVWLWGKIERAERRLQDKLQVCETHRATKLIVIELLWHRLQQIVGDDPVLDRAKKLLDGLKDHPPH